MDIVVRSRHVEVSDRFREHVTEKLTRIERLDRRVQRVDVELSKESNPRLAERAFRVELTCRSRGPVIRAEAAAEEKYAALDLAFGKLESRLRRASDRRTDHHKRSAAGSNGASAGPEDSSGPNEAAPVEGGEPGEPQPVDTWPMVVREKQHVAAPMTLDQALYEMELVGHDFYLFVDVESSRPCVVYRRTGYAYGVIRLAVGPAS